MTATDEYQHWVGREEVLHDIVDPGLVRRFMATFDRSPIDSGAVPQGFHWCLAVPDARTEMLDRDGHPVRDGSGLLPPLPFTRRMWASSKVKFIAPLSVGESISRRSRLARVSDTVGSSGPLIFMDVEHVTTGESGVAVVETQTLVFRPTAPASEAPYAGPPLDLAAARRHRALIPSEPLLFRYSALTFNSHRIHYDPAYAKDVELYRGLVAQGPLTATLILDLVRDEFGDQALQDFSFRGRSPAIAGEALHLTIEKRDNELTLGAFVADGRPVMTAMGTLKA